MSMEIFLGPPGTGKTTTLLTEVEKAIAAGARPDRIAFVSFTKKATQEAVTRACQRFDLSPGDLPFFRTLHSMAFRFLGLKRSDVIGAEHWADFSRIIGVPLRGSVNSSEGSAMEASGGDRILFIENLARMRGVPVIDQWRDMHLGLRWYEVERVTRALAAYKRKHSLLDFTDMITRFNEGGSPVPLDLLIVDEAQDLSHSQWVMVYKIAEMAKRVIIAGDDDQAIFGWAGADVGQFIGLTGDVSVLGQSYRVPRTVQRCASSIISRVRYRRPKDWAARDEDGFVTTMGNIDHLDMSNGSWLVLARNNCFLGDAEKVLRRSGLYYERSGKGSIKHEHLSAIRAWEALRSGGVLGCDETKSVLSVIPPLRGRAKEVGEFDTFNRVQFSETFGFPVTNIWHESLEGIPAAERAYIVANLKRGEKITKEPRIHLSTIHGAKGGEADNVVLYTDIAKRTWDGMGRRGQEDEARVFYVGATRARQSLFVLRPTNTRYFRLEA